MDMYKVYVQCPGCKGIGGYMQDPQCLGAGGWYEEREGIPPPDTVDRRTKIQQIQSAFSKAASQDTWNAKLNTFMEESIQYLKDIADQKNVVELISKIEKARTNRTKKALGKKIDQVFKNKYHQHIIAQKQQLILKGKYFQLESKRKLVYVHTFLPDRKFRVPVLRFKVFMDELLNASAAIRSDGHYEYQLPEIELIKEKSRLIDFICFFYQNDGKDNYLYLLKNTYEKVVAKFSNER